MTNGIHASSGARSALIRNLGFPFIVLIIYGICFIVAPDRCLRALQSSGNAFFNMLLPLVLVFSFMLFLNLFLKPAAIAKYLGKGSGIKGMLLSISAGIVSTGPIHAWYPLLKNLKEKGAVDSPIATFLYSRAVKPFLLPVMVHYFGWLYVAVLTLLTILGSIAVGWFVAVLEEKKNG